MMHQVVALVRKDMLIERRSLVNTSRVMPFALVLLVLFAFALDPDRGTLSQASSGLFWVAVLLSNVMGVSRLFNVEMNATPFEFLRMSGIAPSAIFVAKAIALALELIALQVVLLFGVIVLYDVSPTALVKMAPVCLLATLGLSATGVIYGVFCSGSNARETLLPLLFLPVVAPVMLGATRASEAALGVGLDYGVWMQILGVFAVVYAAVGAVVVGPLMEGR